MIAKNLDDIYAKFQNIPISPDEFEELYVDADAGRGKTVYSRLKRRLMGNVGEGIRLKMLLAGHKGCGKSTELIRLQREIESRFLVLNFSVLKELDILNLNYIELLIVAMEKLFEFVKDEHRIKLDPELLRNIQAWVGSRELLEISERYLGMNLETELKAGIDAPFLAKFFARFKAAAKTSSSLKEALKTKVEPRLSELIFNANLLISNIRDGLSVIDKDDLVIIVEDLDKLQLNKAQDIFLLSLRPFDRIDTIAEDSAKKISAEDYYEALRECAENEIKKPNATDIILDLRNNMTLLNYNGDDWSDVHPVVKEILKEKGYLKSGIV